MAARAGALQTLLLCNAALLLRFLCPCAELISLDAVREFLTREEDTIVFSLIEKAKYPLNRPANDPACLGAGRHRSNASFAELFIRESEAVQSKVFGKTTDLDEQYLELAEVAKSILKKCNGHPCVISTIGGFLSKRPKTPMEWRKLDELIGDDMEMDQVKETIKDILIKGYEGLPNQVKPCFLYMSIFSEDHIISRKRLVRRWIAEGVLANSVWQVSQGHS